MKPLVLHPELVLNREVLRGYNMMRKDQRHSSRSDIEQIQLQVEAEDPEHPAPFFFKFAAASILPNGMVFLPDGTTFFESVDSRSRGWFSHQLPSLKINDFERLRLTPKALSSMPNWRLTRISEPAILGINGVSYNYFHWFTSVLLGLEYLRERGLIKGRRLLCRKLRPWQESTLYWCSFISEGLATQEIGYEIFRVDELLFPPHLQRFDLHFPPPLLRMADRAKANIIQAWKSGELSLDQPRQQLLETVGNKSKVYINRRDTKNRPQENEVDFERSLETRGFVSVSMAKLEFPMQVLVMHLAREVVAFHGAGLTNLLFLSQPRRVIEVLSTLSRNDFEKMYGKLFQARFPTGNYYRCSDTTAALAML